MRENWRCMNCSLQRRDGVRVEFVLSANRPKWMVCLGGARSVQLVVPLDAAHHTWSDALEWVDQNYPMASWWNELPDSWWSLATDGSEG